MSLSLSSGLYNRQNWEDADFPVLCETCLGDNPYVRMIKDKYGKECKICNRPFTVFRWCPGARMRYKKTEICQTCCRLKNVCQTCLLDLEYGLPVEVRDVALKLTNEVPQSSVNREYFMQNAKKELEIADSVNPFSDIGKATAPSDMLLKLARTAPYYKRNRPHICSFWVKGECKRGEECPYRHEKPTDPDDPLANQNIKDRYYGKDDPVAEKLLRRYDEMPKLNTPEDKSVTTLYVGNLSENITEKDLRDQFYQYGEIRSISVIPKQTCAFIQYTTREAAERAANEIFNKLIIKGRRLTIRWGKPQTAPPTTNIDNEHSLKMEPVPGLPKALPQLPEEMHNDFFGLAQPPPLMPTVIRPFPPIVLPNFVNPSPAGLPLLSSQLYPPPPPPPVSAPRQPPAIHYPSQDPSRLGTFHNQNVFDS